MRIKSIVLYYPSVLVATGFFDILMTPPFPAFIKTVACARVLSTISFYAAIKRNFKMRGTGIYFFICDSKAHMKLLIWNKVKKVLQFLCNQSHIFWCKSFIWKWKHRQIWQISRLMNGVSSGLWKLPSWNRTDLILTFRDWQFLENCHFLILFQKGIFLKKLTFRKNYYL